MTTTFAVTAEASLLGLALVAAGAALGALGVVLGGSHEERDAHEDQSSATALSKHLAKLSEQLASWPAAVAPAPAPAPAAANAAPKRAAPAASKVASKVASKAASKAVSKAPAPSKCSVDKLKTAPVEAASKRDKLQAGRATRSA
jgi:hypothetical protein